MDEKPLHQWSQAFTAPADPSVRIWRYMDFPKYISILSNEGFFFSRSDLLGDQFEGSYPKCHKELRPLAYKDSGIPESARKQFSEFVKYIRPFLFVNCWHMNEHESAAMWKLYSQSGYSVAICSTFNKLKDAVQGAGVNAGVVRYIDYESELIPEDNYLQPIMHKRKSFEHEREVRAVKASIPTKDGKCDLTTAPQIEGEWIRVDLSELIDAVYLAPKSPLWFHTVVKDVSSKYGMTKQIILSKLDEEPFF